MAEQQPITHQNEPNLSTPSVLESQYFAGYRAIINEKVGKGDFSKEEGDTLTAVIREITRQNHIHYGIARSEQYPDLSFPVTKISVREIVTKVFPDTIPATTQLQATQAEESSEEPKLPITPRNDKYFIFSNFTLYPNGDAFGFEDAIIARCVQELVQVARYIKNGEPGDVEIYGMGLPTSAAGTIPKNWLQRVWKEGFTPLAKAYAEFVEKEVGTLSSDTYLYFQGESQGAELANRTSKALPEEFKKRSTRILDNPVGAHPKGLRARHIAGGLIAEGMIRDKVVDRVMSQGYNAVGSPRHIDINDKPIRSNLVVLAHVLELFKGGFDITDPDMKTYVRQGTFDPLTRNWKELLNTVYHQPTGQRMGEFLKEQIQDYLNGDGHRINDPLMKFVLNYITRTTQPEIEAINAAKTPKTGDSKTKEFRFADGHIWVYKGLKSMIRKTMQAKEIMEEAA